MSPEGRAVFGASSAAALPRTQRPASETGLPWSLVVTHADSRATSEEFASRRRLLLAGLGLLAILVTAGSYFIWRAMARELAAAQLQSDFVAAVSHEFRTPLTSLRQFNALLAEGEAAANEQRSEFWAAQSRATDRLQRLVESLLDFGRMEAGARPYQFEKVELGALVERAVGDFQQEAGAAGFAIQCTATYALVDADTEALTRALWNLLDNAVKYSGDGRAVTVAVESRADLVSISVSDQGPGIPREEQKEIFGKFVRGAYAREHHIRGTGIGLTMVRHIVEAHAGKIDLVSAPGKGSTFTILLPVRG
jgi:signal transduction histidine kinase